MILINNKKKSTLKLNQNSQNSGSTETQITILTFKINQLQVHFNKYKNDNHSKYGLLQLVTNRRRLLNYLKHKNIINYNNLIKKLELRH